MQPEQKLKKQDQPWTNNLKPSKKTTTNQLERLPTVRSLSRKTRNSSRKGLLDCFVAVVCALKKAKNPFSSWTHPNSEDLQV